MLQQISLRYEIDYGVRDKTGDAITFAKIY